MKRLSIVLGGALALAFVSAPAFAASDTCPGNGDMVTSAKTPQVDLFDGANGKRVKSIDQDQFPTCLPVAAHAGNGMMEVSIDGTNYWVEPHMVNARVAASGKPICRKLAMGGDQAKVGATRGLGEGCPKTGDAQ
ncbi:MAG TPA: hypothetical protein VH000_05925 [Rhizomicrobium sp.]|jgi:hypothetical protein|nr:hypothetical protein [Rhizomicrobium sp.]HEX4533750.1 hypothetical protein [Rhizomicrobium sp.]